MQPQKNSTLMSQEHARLNSVVITHCLSAEEKLSVMEALDHIHVTRQYQEMGSCTVCKKISIKKCSSCGTFYCSSECQTFDWPKHRIICSKQRDSMSDRNSIASSRKLRGANSLKSVSEDILITDGGSPFTALANHLSKKSENIFTGSKSLANFRIDNKHYHQSGNQISKKAETSTSGVREFKKTDKKKNPSPKRAFSVKKLSPDDKKKIGNKKVISKNEPVNLKISSETITYSCNSELSQKSEFSMSNLGRMEVIATYRESPDRYWVMGVHDLTKYEEIQAVLNKECSEYDTIKPKLGTVCAYTFDNEWFRGKIVALTPKPVIHFIDYGNVSNCENNNFKKLTEDLQTLPGLVFLIEFEEEAAHQFKVADLESVRMIIEETSKASDGIPVVKVIEEGQISTEVVQEFTKALEKKEMEKTGLQKQRSVMDTITTSSRGMLFFMPGGGTVRFGSIVPDNNRDAKDCIDRVCNMVNSDSLPHNAKEGDYVLVTDKEGNDQRGKIVCKLGTTYYVRLLDCGTVISADTVYTLPSDLLNLIELGVQVTVEEVFLEEKQMKEIDSCFFAITAKVPSGKWSCLLKNSKDHPIAKVLLEKPPEILEWRARYLPIKSGSTVEISSKSSVNAFYVRSVDGEVEQQLFEMNMDLTQYAQNAKSLRIPPLPGELCCARYEEDDCYYRAVVNAVENDIVCVLFVDFGNVQETALGDVKPLPEVKKKIPFFAVKVQLLNVSARPWNNMIKDYIDKLMSENIELTLTYRDSIEDGVILREKVSGVVVNDFIENAKDRSPELSSGSSETWSPKRDGLFLDEDLKYTTVPSDSVCVVAVLYVEEVEFEKNYSFWATIAESENFNYVNGELSAMIKEYCADVSKTYEPSFRELCLAEYEGCWYRAVCLESEGNVYRVFFVDFGNVCDLDSSSIRKMSAKFIEAPALAMNCTLAGGEKLKGNKKLTSKVCGMLQERMNTLIRGVTITKLEEDNFLLMIPEIYEVLSG